MTGENIRELKPLFKKSIVITVAEAKRSIGSL